jgi:hypothetical protein
VEVQVRGFCIGDVSFSFGFSRAGKQKLWIQISVIAMLFT